MTGARPKCLACGKPCTDLRGGLATMSVHTTEYHAHPGECMRRLHEVIDGAVLLALARLEGERRKPGR